MARVKVALADNIKRVVFLDTDATNGATFGKNLFLADGSVATVASLAALLGVGTASGSTTQAHRLLTGLTLGDDHPQYLRKDTLTQDGDMYVRSGSVPIRLPVGTEGQVFQVFADFPTWVDFFHTPTTLVGLTAVAGTAVTGMRSDGAPAIDQGIAPTWTAVHTFNDTPVVPDTSWTYAKIQDAAALSVLGRSANSSGPLADIVAGSDGDILRRSGTTVGFGAVPESSVTGLVSDLAAIGSALGTLASEISTINATAVFGVVSGTDISVDNTDPQHPVINFSGTLPPDVSAATFVTQADETATLPNSFQLIAGSGVTLTPAANQLTIDVTTGGVGTVTSIDVQDTSSTPIFGSTGGPVTTAGTIDLALVNQADNVVFAGPASGGAAQPTFRALVIADIPTIPAAHTSGFATVATTGAYSDLSGTPTIPPDVSAATFLTTADEHATLPNSRELLAGTNVTFDDTVAHQRTINATGGGGGSGYPPQLGYAGI